MVKIGFDIDGVALNYSKRFYEVFKLFGGKANLSNPEEFNFFNIIDSSDSEKRALYMSFAYMMQETLNAHEDFLSVIRHMILVEKTPMTFVTARSEELAMDSAYRSLVRAVGYSGINEKYAKQFIKIHCVRDEVHGSHGSKVPLLKELGITHFVEDRRKNVLEIAKSGIMVFMPKRSWNIISYGITNIIPYDDASTIVKYLKNQEIYT